MGFKRAPRITITCPICGKQHQYLVSVYKSLQKKHYGECCSYKCSNVKRMQTVAAKRAAVSAGVPDAS
jgi:endogenous inhibitor of DNA gyrase (YacG/DUF329 family)